jgi:hypothetical protein
MNETSFSRCLIRILALFLALLSLQAIVQTLALTVSFGDRVWDAPVTSPIPSYVFKQLLGNLVGVLFSGLAWFKADWLAKKVVGES